MKALADYIHARGLKFGLYNCAGDRTCAGYPGSRGHKRQQVRKLQCMLQALGYCSGPVDGWYGHSTARAVMLFLADNFQAIGYGKKITEEQWNYLVQWAGDRCTEYDKKVKPYYYRYRDYSRGQQYQSYQYNY